MAFNTRAMERELQIMQDMGVNAVRTSHNPPAPELLDLCDRMGIVVWDEAFDKWDGTATLPKGVSISNMARSSTPTSSTATATILASLFGASAMRSGTWRA